MLPTPLALLAASWHATHPDRRPAWRARATSLPRCISSRVPLCTLVVSTGENEPQHIDIDMMMIARLIFLGLTLAPSHEATPIRDSAHGAINTDVNAAMQGRHIRAGAIATLQQVHTEAQGRHAFPPVSSIGRTLVVYITARANNQLYAPDITRAGITAILNRLNTCARAHMRKQNSSLVLWRPAHLPTPTELILCTYCAPRRFLGVMSYQQTTMGASDIFNLTLNMIEPDTFEPNALRERVFGDSTFHTEWTATNYSQYVLVSPGRISATGVYAASASSTSAHGAMVRGSATADWRTWAHLMMQGVSPAGGYSSTAGAYNPGADYYPDMNVVFRFQLGFLAAQMVGVYTSGGVLVGQVRALNSGPADDGKLLLVTVPCPFCTSINPETSSTTGGDLYISFRGTSTGEFGVSDSSTGTGAYSVDSPHTRLTLRDSVHLHYQPTGAHHSEIWKTLREKDAFTIPGSSSNGGVYIMVCDVQARSTNSSITAAVHRPPHCPLSLQAPSLWT